MIKHVFSGIRRRQQRLQRARYEHGAALVESAIVFLPLCLLLFGIIEFGWVFKDSLTLSSATRAGVRTGSALTGTVATSFFPTVENAVATASTAIEYTTEDQLWIYKSDANGVPVGDPTCGGGNGTSTCVVYRFDVTKTWKPKTTPFGWDPTTANTCLGNGTLDSVGVRVTQHRSSLTGLYPWLDNMVLIEKSVMTFEPSNSTATGCA